MQHYPPILTIAGSDSGGGAGIQADLKTIQALGGYGMSAITAITAQNTGGVFGVQEVSLPIIKQQIELVLSDIGAAAIKTGMLASAEIVEVVAEVLRPYIIDRRGQQAGRAISPRSGASCENQEIFTEALHIIIDPVMVAKGGASLLADQAVEALTSLLLPMASVVTPNIPEAERLSGIRINQKVDMPRAAEKILKSDVSAAIIKGGHLDTGDGLVHNLLMTERGEVHWIQSPHIATKNTHGTGCTFSAAIATLLGHGKPLTQAFEEAEAYVRGAIEHAPNIGHGHGPLNHGWNTQPSPLP